MRNHLMWRGGGGIVGGHWVFANYEGEHFTLHGYITNMTAPMARVHAPKVMQNLWNCSNILQKNCQNSHLFSILRHRQVHTGSSVRQFKGVLSKYRRGLVMTTGCVFGFTVVYTWVTKNKDVFAAEMQLEGNPPVVARKVRPEPRISREVSEEFSFCFLGKCHFLSSLHNIVTKFQLYIMKR